MRVLNRVMAACAITVLAAGCTPSANNDPIATSGVEPTGAIEFWHAFTDREAKAVDDLVSDFRAKFPKVTVTVKGEQDDGTSNIGNDPKWTELITWQRDLVDWFGYDKLEEFRAGLGDEWSAENAFQQGKVP